MTQRQVFQRFKIREEVLSLEVSEKRFYISSPSTGEAIEVTDTEGTVILNELIYRKSEDRLDEELQLRGLYLDDRSKNSALSQQVTFIRSRLPSDDLLVMLDTTTVRNAFECLEYSRVTPLNLLDLAILSFAAICFDRIVVQPYVYKDYLKRRSDAFAVMEYPDGFIPTTLWRMCVDANSPRYEGLSGRATAERSYTDAWAELLGINPSAIRINLNAFDHYQDSPYFWDGVLASSYVLQNVADIRKRNEFLSIQTMRVLFNDKLAGFLGFPYLSSSFRACIHSRLIAAKVETRLLLDKLLSAVGPPISKAGEDYPFVSEFSAPFLLGIILEQINSPQEFWPILAKYRKQLSPLRRRISEDRGKWKGRSSLYLNEFISHLKNGFSEHFKGRYDVIESSASVGTTLATASTLDVALIGLGVKLLKLLNPAEKLYPLFLKHFRPDVYPLFSLADEAKHLRMIEERVSSIWGKSWSRNEHEQLDLLAASYPGEFLRLRKVG